MSSILKRLLLMVLPTLVGVIALFPATPASAASATKVCTLTAPNVYMCTFTITPAIATGPGSWLVQMVPGPGTFTGTKTVTSASGCSSLPAITPGTAITSPSDMADYDVTVGAGGCTAAAVVVITETVTVTASGQICQKVWITPASPFAINCATVVYTPPPPAAAAPSATKSCTLTNTANVYTCLFTVTPGFPAAASPPTPGGDYIHVNEAPGPLMTGPGTILPTPTVMSVSGCSSTALPVVMSIGNGYNTWMGVNGCPGTTWSVTFSETIVVTSSGQLCQSFWMVAAVPPTTACATVYFTKSLPVTPSPGKGTFASAPVYAMSKLASTVFFGGTAAELDAALITTAASGAWVQDRNGMFFLYIVGGGFVNGAFKAAFPTGLPNPSALTVVGR